MTLIATIPTGYKLTVNGADYSAGEKTINIAVAETDPVIALSVDTSTGNYNKTESNIKLSSLDGILSISGVNAGDFVRIYNAGGQLINEQKATSLTIQMAAKGLVIVKINSFISKTFIK